MATGGGIGRGGINFLRGGLRLLAKGLTTSKYLLLDADAQSGVLMVTQPSTGAGNSGINFTTGNPNNASSRNWGLITNFSVSGDMCVQVSTNNTGNPKDGNTIVEFQNSGVQFVKPITSVGNIQSSGVVGVPVVVGQGFSSAQTAAVASVAAFAVGASDALFEVSAFVDVTVATNHSFTVTCAYTDEAGTSRTLTMPFTLVAGSAIVNTVANANGAVPYMGFTQLIRAKAATSITIATTGTFTTVTYDVAGVIKQVA